MIKKEELLHLKVCDYLRKNYPDVLFRTDFSSGMKMTPGQAAKHKKFQKSRAWPDLFIAKPTMKIEYNRYAGEQFLDGHAGLFLELKAEGVKLYKKNGEMVANKHYQEQAEMLEKLRSNKYKAEFVIGYEDAIKQIHDYLGEPKHKEVEF
jgi:hypothetical protein